ncbi:MAG: NAD(P)-binding domain-containing protein [Eubacterium sp.]|nr:NAD(P)-binding domain-containing protein [Eubacterium sp.]
MDRKVGIIGYGSMGKMLLWKFAEAGVISKEMLLVANRTREKLDEASSIATICESNAELAAKADIIFVCVRPSDMKGVFEEVLNSIQSDQSVQSDKLLVSLNGNITFDTFDKIGRCRMAKVIPSLTAEIDRSQTLICFNELADVNDKERLKQLLSCIGEVIELPEHEMGMGSELVSCMPGFIASVFDVLCQAGKKHTEIPEEQVVKMVLNTLSATSDLMLRKGMTFEEVVNRVATKGGITQEGTKVVYEGFPTTADLLFEKTLEKRRLIAENARKSFDEK